MDNDIVKSMESLLNNQEIQQMRTQLSTNIVTIVGVALLYGIMQLAGEYLTTFVFTFIVAIALASIKKTLLQKVQDVITSEVDELYDYRFFKLLHLAKFSLLFRILILICRHLTSLQRCLDTTKLIVSKAYDATLIPYVFAVYVLCFKFNLMIQLVIVDLMIWATIDVLRGLKWIAQWLHSCCTKPKGPNRDHQIKPRDRMVLMIDNLQTSHHFNTLIFLAMTLLVLILVPLSFFCCYNDIMQYKQVITPNLAKLQLYDQFEEYLRPEYMLKQLEGSYISEDMAAQFYQYFNNNHKGVDLLSVFWDPDHYEKMKHLLAACQSTFCQVRVFATNYGNLNTEFNEILQNGLKQFQSVLPQIQEALKFLAAILLQVFEGSMGFIFKFMLFYQGVLYLMNESSIRVQDLIIFNVGKSFKETLSQNLNNHITGVFVALTQIFIYHFMLSYLLLDISGIELSFIVSILVAIFSLTQIVSPSVFYLMIIVVWHLIGTQVTSATFMWASAGIFFFWSGSIYQTCFEQHLGNPFWIAISVILGYISFQWKGIVYGPLLIGFIRSLGAIVDVYLKEKSRSTLSPNPSNLVKKINQTKSVIEKVPNSFTKISEQTKSKPHGSKQKQE